jgi:hypothetical protein
MKLRYVEIDPEIIVELPDWNKAEIERESDQTLKDLGINRQPDESHLNAWARAMLEENGCKDNAENRNGLIEAIRQDTNALRFVWVFGGEERTKFGLDDSPEFEEYRARKAADRALMAAFAQAPDTSHPGGGGTRELDPFSEVVVWVWMVLSVLLPLAGIVIIWRRGDPWIPRILLTAVFSAAFGYLLILLVKEFPWSGPREEPVLNQTLSIEADEETDMREGSLLRISIVLLSLILAVLLWDSFFKPQPKATGRFQPLAGGYRAFDTKTGKVCASVEIHYDSFRDVEVEGADTFEVPEVWEDARVQSYLKTYKAEDPEDFRQPGKKEFHEVFDNSLLPTCSKLE